MKFWSIDTPNQARDNLLSLKWRAKYHDCTFERGEARKRFNSLLKHYIKVDREARTNITEGLNFFLSKN